MSVYTDLVDAASDESSNLFKQVIGAIWKAAWAITNESADVEDHAIRLAWADRIVAGGLPHAREAARRMMIDVLANPTVRATPNGLPDGDFDFVIASILPAWLERG